MQPELQTALKSLLQHQSLSDDAMQQAIGALMDGRCEEAEIAALLTALAMNGETEAELAGAAAAMRARVSVIPTKQTGVLDTCGTGGDSLHTFNISTATALVVSALGVPVAKHGNRSVSSSSGAADVLETMGVNINITAEQAGKCLDEIGLCFCYARVMHSAMKHVGPVRQKLGIRTIFNFLGPLTNPAGAKFQLLGAPRLTYAEKIAGAASRLGTQRTLVVCGNDQLDEVALWGKTAVWDVQGSSIQQSTWTAADFDLPECSPDVLKVLSPQESAEVITGIFTGRTGPGPSRNMILANAAAALFCRGEVTDLRAGVTMAAEAIDSGEVSRQLQKLVDWTQAAAE